jgi:hypothetical protein
MIDEDAEIALCPGGVDRPDLLAKGDFLQGYDIQSKLPLFHLIRFSKKSEVLISKS